MSAPAVLLDACTLVPIRLASCLFALAEAGLLAPLWSDEILDEVERNLPKVKGMTSQKAKNRVSVMREAFDDEACVGGYQGLMPELTCDEKDRHVLAAAITGGADVLLTFNLKDFPATSAEPHGVAIQHPDQFLLALLSQHPRAVLDALQADAARYRKPPMSMAQYFAALTGVVPMFATLAHDALIGRLEDPAPVAAFMEADEVTAVAAFGDSGDLTNPAQVALLWWAALMHDSGDLPALTLDPSAWGDYAWARDLLQRRSLASRVIPLVDAPDRVVVMRFIDQVSVTARVFAAFSAGMVFLTLVRLQDDTWRVWGLGPQFLAARDILE